MDAAASDPLVAAILTEMLSCLCVGSSWVPVIDFGAQRDRILDDVIVLIIKPPLLIVGGHNQSTQ